MFCGILTVFDKDVFSILIYVKFILFFFLNNYTDDTAKYFNMTNILLFFAPAFSSISFLL